MMGGTGAEQTTGNRQAQALSRVPGRVWSAGCDQSTARRAAKQALVMVAVALSAILLAPPPTLAQPLLCDAEPPAGVPRPLWLELAPPAGSGYPDYQTVSNNLQLIRSIKLLASVATRAAQSLQDLTSEVEDPEAEGRCVCCVSTGCIVPEFYLNLKRKDCTAAQCTALEGPDYPIWLPTDLFKNSTNTARFALKQIDFLDKLKDELSQIAQALQALGSDLDNLADLVQQYLDYVDLLTEGYHLGGYSSERPNLHLCVGYGGHGAFAEMANLFGEVSIGSRYTSHNLSAEHRAQFRSGGFAVTAFGRALSVLPGLEANVQMDGFKLWDAARPFGVDLGVAGDVTCASGPGFRIADVDQYDLFHLIDPSTDLTPFDTSADGCLQPGEFLIRDFYEATYLSAAAGSSHTWPRAAFPHDWEKQNTALFSAGLNLPIEMKPIEKLIPATGIVLFPGATLYPKLTLKAGAAWEHKAYGLRERLQDAVNENLPPSAQLGPDDFERPMHALQAPDVSEDNGASAYVKPRIAADLVLGIALSRYLTLGITASVGTSVRVEPAAHGGLHDLNVSLATALLNSNPPPDLPCDPIIEDAQTTSCSNELFHKPDPRDPSQLIDISTGNYSCATTQVVVFHCKEPEDGRSCTPAKASVDCPLTGECVAEYGCAAHGYCTRILEAGPDRLEGTADDVLDVQHDTTYAACIGSAVCDEAAVNAGSDCDEDADCVGPTQCLGGDNAGKPCKTDRDCPRGECKPSTAPCVVISPVGYFTPYQCLVHSNPEIAGWQGPGCHPLTVGFPSACGCQSDDDCVAGVETCVDGACSTNSQPVTCTCDPGNPTCGSGRLCRDGGCVLDCSVNGAADCAAYQTCTNGTCANSYGIPFAEQIVWQITNTPKPQHAVTSYALSDVLTSAILDAGLWIGLDLKLFKKLYHFPILDISDYWTLLAFNKSWYQAGLEARYQNDCDPVSGSTVSNWQPGTLRVKRYNPGNATSGSYGNAGTLADLQQWCLNELPNEVADPAGPTTGDISSSATDLLTWGENIGMEVWALGGLCVTNPGAGGVASQPFTQWLNSLNANPAGLQCLYSYNMLRYLFPCSDLQNELLLVWGCLDVTANPWGPQLASAFPNTVVPASTPFFNVPAMLSDPAAEFTLDNLQPAIRSHGLFAGHFWYQSVTQCFEQNYATMGPGDIHLLGVDVGPCCGNRVRDVGGCERGPGVPPCEQCDDGNTTAGDGCSPLCRSEGRPRPLGTCGNGIVDRQDLETCDDGNQIPADGCEPDCTRTPVSCVGDCDGSSEVTVDELVTGVNIALGSLPLSACRSFDTDTDGAVTVDELVRAVNDALAGCVASR